DDDAADQYGALAAEQPIADPAAGETGDIGAADIEAVNRGRGTHIEPEATLRHAVDQEQHQQRAHAVEAQPLPHLEKKERRQTGSMTEALLFCRIAANKIPPSNNRYMGTAIAVCDITSGGVRMAAMMNTTIST